jgi:hypothetical protein
MKNTPKSLKKQSVQIAKKLKATGTPLYRLGVHSGKLEKISKANRPKKEALEVKPVAVFFKFHGEKRHELKITPFLKVAVCDGIDGKRRIELMTQNVRTILSAETASKMAALILQQTA